MARAYREAQIVGDTEVDLSAYSTVCEMTEYNL